MSNNLSSGEIAGLITLSHALSFGGNIATSAINSHRAYDYQVNAMKLQDQLNRKFYQWSNENGPTFARRGYVNAGYNPLLALGSNLTGTSAIYNAGAVNSDSDNGSQAVASALDAMRLRNENKLNRSQIDLNKSQEDLNTQNTYKTFADELKSRAEANVANATEAKIINDIRWDNVINDARFKEIVANAKFQNERARGFSASSSESHNYGFGADGSISKGKFKVGSFGGNANYSSSKSESRAW